MESILKTIQSVVPLIAYYPTWAQVLFSLTFILILSSTAVFVLQYNDSSVAQKRAESAPKTQLAGIGVTDNSSYVDVSNVIQSKEYLNDFPVLDLKFHNQGKTSELITRIKIKTIEVEIDKTPSLEYSIEVVDGDLVLLVRNFGWGDAKNFKANIDLSQFDHSLKIENSLSIEKKVIQQSIISEEKKLSSNIFTILRKEEVLVNMLPVNLVRPLPPESSERDDLFKFQNIIKKNGITPIQLVATYESNDGVSHKDEMKVVSIERGAYDNKRIYFSDDRFEYVGYDKGVRYSLISPSAIYNLMVNVNDPAIDDEISVAHEIPPGGFDRFGLTIGANKSATLKIVLQFDTNNRKKIETPEFNIQIWNPRNTFYSLRGGEKSSMLSTVRESRIEPYDVGELQERRTRSWGY
ncbi:MAG: hypothetical protein QTN59_15405 [Candidatus Electrothrix communis]|nr:MAG: hypothetical protein QTN59_15405 [Candidatus Electrothrix communis]